MKNGKRYCIHVVFSSTIASLTRSAYDDNDDDNDDDDNDDDNNDDNNDVTTREHEVWKCIYGIKTAMS